MDRSVPSFNQLEIPVPEVMQINDLGGMIQMNDEWLDGISSFSNKSFFRSIAELYRDNATCIERLVALHITEALSQAGNYNSWPEYSPDEGQTNDAAQEDGVFYTRYFHTDAYRFESSIGIPLAFSFLLLHILMVLRGSSWDDMGEVLVFTLKSQPSGDLAQESAKAKSKVWVKAVTISPDDGERRSQVIVREEKGY
ncbi:hypothetical protein FGRMN_449 [Fusarium graminum]|nr:hypothetical protein FGRMN_449 [Fusarium graminum]